MTEEKKSFKQKVIDFKNRQKEKIQKKWNWLKENHEVAIPLVATAGTLIATVINAGVAKDELALKLQDRNTFKDPNTNVTWELNHKPNNDQKKAIASAIRTGQPVEEVLEDFDLLK